MPIEMHRALRRALNKRAVASEEPKPSNVSAWVREEAEKLIKKFP